MTDPIVTMVHYRAVRIAGQKLCSRGGRGFAARLGLDWSQFVRHGLAASVLEATGDAMALRLAAQARAEADRGRQQ